MFRYVEMSRLRGSASPLDMTAKGVILRETEWGRGIRGSYLTSTRANRKSPPLIPFLFASFFSVLWAIDAPGRCKKMRESRRIAAKKLHISYIGIVYSRSEGLLGPMTDTISLTTGIDKTTWKRFFSVFGPLHMLSCICSIPGSFCGPVSVWCRDHSSSR